MFSSKDIKVKVVYPIPPLLEAAIDKVLSAEWARKELVLGRQFNLLQLIREYVPIEVFADSGALIEEVIALYESSWEIEIRGGRTAIFKPRG